MGINRQRWKWPFRCSKPPHLLWGRVSFFFYAKDVSRSGTRGALNRNCLQTLGQRSNLNTSSSSQWKPPVCFRMDVNRRLGMRDTVLALLLAVLQGFPLGETAPNPSPLVGSNWGNPRRYVHLQTSTDLNNFYLEIRLDGTVRKTTVRSSYSKMCFPLLKKNVILIFVMWQHEVLSLTL